GGDRVEVPRHLEGRGDSGAHRDADRRRMFSSEAIVDPDDERVGPHASRDSERAEADRGVAVSADVVRRQAEVELALPRPEIGRRKEEVARLAPDAGPLRRADLEGQITLRSERDRRSSPGDLATERRFVVRRLEEIAAVTTGGIDVERLDRAGE